MTRRLLLGYQIITGLSDSSTGLLLIFSPATTLHLMKLHSTPDALPFISYIGAFVLSVGIACFYGGWLVRRSIASEKLEVVWLLTAITRGLVTLFVIVEVVSGGLEPGWITVALTDGTFALLQFYGLKEGWSHCVRD